MSLERDYQAKLIRKLKLLFPGCIILKNDPEYFQGIPDLSIFYNDCWAMLEVKRDEKATHRPNQDFWINYINQMSYAAYIYPENEEAVIDDLQRALRVGG